jgi:hypothetical protein
LDDRDCFRIQTCDVQPEHTAQSQEKDIDDVERSERPSASKAPKKASAEKDIIHVTSSDGPPESRCHVSRQLLSIMFFRYIPLSSPPPGEWKFSHLCLPSIIDKGIVNRARCLCTPEAH